MAKTILITGCSSGFGKLAAGLLLQRGHRVIGAVRGGQARLESVFPEEVKQYGDRFIGVDLHMEKMETFEAAAKLIESRFGGKLDVLVNNAGYGLFGALEEQAPEQIRHQIEVNFFGPTLLTRRLLPYLRAAQGRVIFLSSVAGLYGFPLYGTYAASKFALEGLVESMYFELRPQGVQVGLIEPGGFKTDFTTRSPEFGTGTQLPSSPYQARSNALKRAFVEKTSRLGNPIRVARLIVRSCERGRLPLRRRIGMDAGLLGFLEWLLPSGLRVRLIDRAFRLAVFKD